MKMVISRQFLHIGMEDAKQVAKTYHLDEEKNELMVVDNVENLNLRGKTFHTGFVLICVCRSGNVTFTLNDRQQQMKAGDLLVTFGETLVSDVQTDRDFSAMAIVVSHDFMQESIMSMMHLWPYLLYLMKNPVIQLGEEELARLTQNYRLIIERLTLTDHAFRREATIANVQACYLDVCDLLKRRAPQNEASQSRAYGIFDKFIRALAAEYVVHRDVQWYAAKLGLTPKYLTEVVRDVSGRTTSQWINSFVITELKSLLRHTDLSIKEIAIEMHFADQSFLGKYFKNIVGISPMDFRNQS